jgi:hypothetical protein
MSDDELLDEILGDVEALRTQLPRESLGPLFEERARGLAPGAPGRAAWLTHAGEQWEMNGDPARARACYEEAARDGGAAYIDPRAEMLNVLFELGETGRVDELLAELRRDLEAGWEGRFVHEFVGESLELHGRLDEALRWYTDGLSRAQREDPENIDVSCLNGRYRVRRALELQQDRYDLLAEERRRDYAAELDEEDELRLLAAPAGPEAATVAVLYWPERELAAVLERWPALAELYGSDHARHRSVVEHRLRELAADRGGPVGVGVGELQEYLRFAEERRHDPEESSTRAAYAAHLGNLRRVAAWPPRPGARCWCGSGLKYTRCCGALR